MKAIYAENEVYAENEHFRRNVFRVKAFCQMLKCTVFHVSFSFLYENQALCVINQTSKIFTF